jgi:hypothetical protein
MRKVVGTILTAVAGVVGVAFLAVPQAAADSPWDKPGPDSTHVQVVDDDSPWD